MGTFRVALCVVVAIASASCALPDNNIGVVAHGGVSVSTDQSTYPSGSPVTVHYEGLPGNAFDWIAVSTAGAPDSSYLGYTYTSSATSGDFVAGVLPAGDYEARAYVNDSFTIIASSMFSVEPPADVSIVTDKSLYAPGETVHVTFENLPGNAADWIAITPHGSAPETFTDWTYTGGLVSGSFDFVGLGAGEYDARVYVNDSFTIIASATFAITMAGTPSVSTTAPLYPSNERIEVRWANLPGNATDWIALATVGSPDTSFLDWKFVQGLTSGTTAFRGLPVGSYEVRAFVNDSFTRVATGTFEVTFDGPAPTLPITVAPTAPNQPIQISWSNFPTNPYEWIAIAPAVYDRTKYLAFVYTNGQASGTATLPGMPAGEFVVRGYRHSSFEVIAATTIWIGGQPTCDGGTINGPAFVISKNAQLALRNVTSITGTLTIGGEVERWFTLPCLQHVGGLDIDEPFAIESLVFPALTEITGDVRIRSRWLEILRAPALVTIGGRLSLLTKELPSLSGLSSVTTLGSLLVCDKGLTTVGMTSLTHVFGGVGLGYTLGAQATSCGTDLRTLTSLGLPSLTRIDGDLAINDTSVTSLADLEGVTDIGGSFVVRNNASLASLGLEALTSVGALAAMPQVQVTNNPQLPTCDAVATVNQLTTKPAPAQITITGNQAPTTCP